MVKSKTKNKAKSNITSFSICIKKKTFIGLLKCYITLTSLKRNKAKRPFLKSKISTNTCSSKIRRERVRKSSNNKTTQIKAKKTKTLSNSKRRTKGFSITFPNTQRLILSCKKNYQLDGSSTIVTFLLILCKK